MATHEAQVLAAVCANRDIHHIIGEDAKIFGAYGDVFKFITDYNAKYRKVPSVSLVNEKFEDAELPEKVDGTTPHYVNELKQYYVGNRIDQIIDNAVNARKTGSMAPAQILEVLNTSFSKLGKFTNNVRDFNIMDFDKAMEHFDHLRERAATNNGAPGIATGWASIDSCYPTGLAGGHSIVAMGYTGRGKSLWADALAVNVHAQGRKVMIVSLEMSPEEQMERLYPIMSSGLFKNSDMARGDVNVDDFRSFSSKYKDSPDLIIVSNQGVTDVTPNSIQAKIDIHRPDFVIVDYMQLLMDNAKTQAMTPRMLNLSREIKLTAVSNDIPILSITAVTDEDGDKRDAPPLLKQVAWSRGIEYDANLAIAIHRHDDSDMVEVVGRKNRHGSLFDFYFDVDFDAGVWEERFD